MAIATRLTPKAMTTLGVMAFVTLCFQTFISSAFPSIDATTLARLDTIERQMATLQSTVDHVLRETNTSLPSDFTWPNGTQSSSGTDTNLAEVTKMVFGIAAILAWAASMSTFFEEMKGIAQRTFAMGIWTACATFVALWYFGEPREWYGYLLGANWGFMVAIFLSAGFDGWAEGSVGGEKA